MSFPTDPTESYEGSIYGFGPFQSSGGGIIIPTAHPHKAGYGGSAFDGGTFRGSAYGMQAYGDGLLGGVPQVVVGGYGQSEDGGEPYGNGLFPVSPFGIDGGYGGDPFGLGAYGSREYVSPYLASAVSLNGYEIELFFSEEMEDSANLLDPNTYELLSILGGDSEILSIRVGSRDLSDAGSQDYSSGVLSIIITHTGTMLGGTYKIRVVQPVFDLGGNAITIVEDVDDTLGQQPNEVSLLTKGQAPTYSISVVDGKTLLVDFSEDVLSETEFPNGVESISSYSFDDTVEYPVQITVQSAEYYGTPIHSNQFDKVSLTVQGMTSLTYNSVISDSTAFDYQGAELPSDNTTLTGTEVGTGTSSVGSFLSLSKSSGDVYGWRFEDTSGKVIPITSTYQFDLVINASNTVFTPTTGTFATLTVDDGNIKVQVSFQRIGLDDYLDIGGISSVKVDWSSSQKTISVIRNQKAQVYVFVVEGTPIASIPIASFVVGGTFTGAEFILSSAFDVLNFHLLSLTANSSNTIYSKSWNFMHNVLSSFVGSAELTKDSFLTERGPLVKGWGDHTLATKNDVAVRVNGISVEVSKVNPYIGEITTTIPIPLMPIGTMSVEVDYEWFATPKVEMGGLNTEGSVLNKFDLRRERNTTSLIDGERGVADTSRFTMGLVLPFSERRDPLYIGHRYIGFEQAYTGSINSPTTFLLNQNPNSIAVDRFEKKHTESICTYEGETTPSVEEWGLFGSNSGGVQVGLGTYELSNIFTSDTNLIEILVTVGIKTNNHPYFQVFGASAKSYSLDGIESPALRLRSLNSNTLTYRFNQEDSSNIGHPIRFYLDPNKNTEYTTGVSTIGVAGSVGSYVEIIVDEDTPQTLYYQCANHNLMGNYVTNEGITLYFKKEDFTFDSAVNVVARFQVLTTTLNGVFTGVGFGFHNNHQLFFIGAVTINGVEHIGLLKDSHRLDTVSSWELAFNVDGEIKQKNQIVLVTSEIPEGVEVSDRFQILTGTQIGTYTISEIYRDERFGVTTLFTNEDFPSDFTLYGNAFVKVIFEVKHTERNTYRLVSDHNSESVQLYISGHISGYGLSLTSVERVEPVFFDLDTTEQGQVVWGNLDPNSTCSSSWSFFRYSVSPSENKKVSFGHRVFTELETLPQENPNTEWFLETDKGNSYVVGSVLSLSSLSDYAFTRVEPFLTNKADLDVAVKIKSDFFVGTNTFVEIWDTNKTVRLAFVCYQEPSALYPTRRLVSIPHSYLLADSLSSHKEDGYAVLSGSADISTPILDISSIQYADPTDRKVEIRLSANTYTFDSSGFADFYSEIKLKNNTLYLYFTNTGLSVSGDLSSLNVVFDWKDNLFHTYKIVLSSGNLSLSVDDIVLGTVTITTISSAVADQSELVRYVQTTATTLFHYLSLQLIPPTDVKKTLGVYLGGDESDINSWQLPRTDTSHNANSSAVDVVIQEVDWSSTYQEIRIHRDVTWGVTVLLDTLGSPPYFDGDYATDITVPSAGWINVEYARLPRKILNRKFGFVQFGGSGFSSQKIEWVRYRLFDHPYEDYRSPQGMVLNNYNVISSGESLVDTTPEVLEIVSLDRLHVLLSVSHIYSDLIYKVIVDSVVISENEWSFNSNSQLITFSEGILSSDHQVVTVVCRVNDKPTTTYLKNQPLLESVNLLNEETPSFAKSRLLDTIRTIKSGTAMGDTVSSEGDPLTGIVSTSNHQAVGFETDPNDLYESLSFVQVDNGGDEDLISSFCDSPFAEHGLREIALSGKLFYDKANKILPYPKFNQGGGFPSTFFFASGGSKQTGGTLNNTQTLTYPLALSGTQNRTFLVLRMKQVVSEGVETDLQEDISFPTTTDVPTAHSSATTSPSASTPSGGCYITIKQSSIVPRLGPAGGLPSLTPSGNHQITVGAVVYVSFYTTSSLLNGGIVLQGGAKLPTGFEHSQVLEQA